MGTDVEADIPAGELTIEPLTEQTLSEADQFLEEVLIDGRFVHEVREHSRDVAHRLGLTISDATVSEVESTPREVMVLRLFERRFGRGSMENQSSEAEMFAVPFVLGVVAIGIVAVIAVIWAVKYAKDPPLAMLPIDHSLKRDSKL